MTEPLTFTLWLLLAVVQQHGAVGLSFGTQAGCLEVRAVMAPAPETIAISQCVPVELVRVRP